MTAKQTEPKWILALEWLVLSAIIALATYLRYWRIEEVPPGFNSDEAVGAMGALKTLREGVQYSYEGQGGGGALGFYFATVAFYLFGPSIATIRGLAAWAGVMSIFANYWAIREVFRPAGLKQARWLAGLTTLGLATSLWHITASRIAFAGIGVPFLMLPSVYFLWLGLNATSNSQTNPKSFWPFAVSGIFLGGLMYIYLSGVFFPPFYAAFFIAQWLIIKLSQKFNLPANPPEAYLTARFWHLFVTAATAALLILPIAYVLLFRPELEPATTRVSQAFFLNPQVNGGDPWGLLWRSIIGNFSAYGISLSWLIGQPPRLSYMPTPIGFIIFLGFLISLWRGLRGQASYLFILLWFCILLLPSILAPDIIPHDLRAIGATTPTFVFAAVFLVSLFEALGYAGQRWLQPRLGQLRFTWLARGVGGILALSLAWGLSQANAPFLYYYFYVFPHTEDARAAYHVYAVDIAREINKETDPGVAFILPRNTAAGDVFRNYTTDFLVELAQPPAAHYWVIDDERTLPDDLAKVAAGHNTIRIVRWKTSKHTGADPKGVMHYYLEKYGYHDFTNGTGYYDLYTYRVEAQEPNFRQGETLQPIEINFGQQLQLTGYALGDAGEVSAVNQPQAYSGDLLWLRLAWKKIGDQPENLKASALVYTEDGQRVNQVDKQLLSNLLQVGSRQWAIGDQEDTYFLVRMPPATPPGRYQLHLAVYGEESLTRLPLVNVDGEGEAFQLADITVNPAPKPNQLEKLKLALTVQQEILPGLTLAGFETLAGPTVRSGQQVSSALVWQAGEIPPGEALSMALVAKPAEGHHDWAALSEPVGLAGPDYPTNQWRPGETLRGWLSARVPPAYEPGLYELSLRLSPANDPAHEIMILPIGEFQVEGWSRNFDTPTPQRKIGAAYGEQATLVGVDAAAQTLSPGDTLTARLYWQAEAEFTEDYKTFFQLVGPDGLLYGQVDQVPGAGAFPTSGWLPGEYITDDYQVSLAPNAPKGDYKIAIGLYNPDTGERLPVEGGGCQADACILPGLMVQ